MVTHAEIDRRQALIELLARPDEAPLHRGHRLVLEGSPDRYQLCPVLASAYVQAALLRWREPAGPDRVTAAAAAARVEADVQVGLCHTDVRFREA